ncbi:glycosyltransferase family 4 protein [Pseudonocardia sp. CA-107938]|uniref:glycosyltransferase family 4 protein n=1 Tax=Pseudonocardia sp. CA-107938 TaxID=3240021 RepID=UPI003D904ECD
MRGRRRALAVSTSLQTRGGISSYVRMLRGTELWTRWNVQHIATHRDGGVGAKVGAFAVGLVRYLGALAVRRPDVVHVHMSSYGSFVRKAVVCWTAWAVRVPVVLHVHGSEFDVFHDRLPRPLRATVRATLERAAVVVALGERWAQRLRDIAPAARVVTIPNAVHVPPPAEPRNGPPRVVFLGEIGERKGAFALLDAWTALAAEGLGGAHLTMAGDREHERARALVAERGLAGSVSVHSWLSPAEVADLLSAADVFVLPSRSEGQPMALLEAMAHGLCVVVSDVGGIPEMVDDETSGLLVPADDVEALTDALRRVLADPELAARLGAAARKRVLAEFDVDVVWRRFDALYEEVRAR